MDLAFGLMCIEQAGVDPKDIFIYVDGKDRVLVSQLLALGTANSYKIGSSSDFFADISGNGYENLVLFVTGHGSIEGIDAAVPITPYALLKAIKSSPELKSAIAYLGQCHAGIFNYIGAGRSGRNPSDPDVILIGATNLHESLSSSTTEDFLGQQITWVANLFLLSVFKWLTAGVDVDGDGKLTVIDSYKYAGVTSNSVNKNIKIGSFVRSIDLHQRWKDAQSDHSTNPSPAKKLALQALEEQYVSELGVRYTHQECWILNSIPAQCVEF
ncbi:hypothetical protein [Pseudomonas alkylphenolica]|nr:hypothetical protein [Pseudomonas alkylphenolica]